MSIIEIKSVREEVVDIQNKTDEDLKKFYQDIKQLLWQSYPAYICLCEKEFWQNFFSQRAIYQSSIAWIFMLIFGKVQEIQESWYYYLVNLPFLIPFAVTFYGHIQMYVHQKWVSILKEAWLLSSDGCLVNKNN
jgi:hypothetical protein